MVNAFLYKYFTMCCSYNVIFLLLVPSSNEGERIIMCVIISFHFTFTCKISSSGLAFLVPDCLYVSPYRLSNLFRKIVLIPSGNLLICCLSLEYFSRISHSSSSSPLAVQSTTLSHIWKLTQIFFFHTSQVTSAPRECQYLFLYNILYVKLKRSLQYEILTCSWRMHVFSFRHLNIPRKSYFKSVNYWFLGKNIQVCLLYFTSFYGTGYISHPQKTNTATKCILPALVTAFLNFILVSHCMDTICPWIN